MSVPITPVGPSVPSVSPLAKDHTLQAFIELIYVKTANNTLVSQMASLEQALATTKGVMDTLTRLQNLHNLITVKSKGQFSARFFSAGATITTYKNAASAFFGSPVFVSASFAALSGGFAAFQSQMQALKVQIQSQIATLSGTTPLVNGQEDSNSLLAKLRLVLRDINSSQADVSLSGATKWIIDSYNKTATAGVTSAGLFQQHLTNAITAGQSLNTTQTESVRNFLFLFEEYYKSASSILQAVTQIIQKIADGIAR